MSFASQKAESLLPLLRDKMNLRQGADFATKVEKAGRRLPKWARRDAAVILEAMALETHPKLAQQVDKKAVRKAHKNLKYFLERQDPWQRQRNRLLDWAALVAFAIFVTLGLVIAVLVWRGIV